MHVQYAQEIAEIAAGAYRDFNHIKSNAPYCNPMVVVYPLRVIATYHLRVYFDDILYPTLNVDRTAERAMDMLVLTPQNRYMPPNIGLGVPGSNNLDTNPLYSIPVILRIYNHGREAVVFYVGSTWEAFLPGGR